MADLSKLSLADLKKIDAAQDSGNWQDVPEYALRVYLDEPYDSGEVFSTAFGRAASSSVRGIYQLFGGELGEEDLDREAELRAMLELNPAASISGLIAGSVADPVNIATLPFGGAVTSVGKGVMLGMGMGGASGVIEPVYEEYGDSRLFNTAVAAGVGGALTGGVTALVKKFAGKSPNEIQEQLVNEATADLGAAQVSPSAVIEEGLLGGRKPAAATEPAAPVTPTGPPDLTPQPFTLGTSEALAARSAQQAEELWQIKQPTVNTAPPMQLLQAKPGYNYGSQKLDLDFDSPLTKAIYIVGTQPKKAKNRALYVDFLERNGLSEVDAMKLSDRIRSQIKNEASQGITKVTAKMPDGADFKPVPPKSNPTAPSQAQLAVNAFDLNSIPPLPKTLHDIEIKINGVPVRFSNDLDKAAFGVARGGKDKEEFLKYIKSTLSLSDEDAAKFADDVVQGEKSKIIKTIKQTEEPSIVVKTSSKVSDDINPITKHMDDDSKNAFEIGENIELNKGKLKGSPEYINKSIAQIKGAFPDASDGDAILIAQGYNRLMKLMKDVEGSKFTSTNIVDFANNKNSNIKAYISAVERGDYDGCWTGKGACLSKQYSRFMPEKFDGIFDGSDLRRISEMPVQRANNMIGALAKVADKETIEILEKVIKSSPEIFPARTRIGGTVGEQAKDAKQYADEILKDIDPNDLDAGMKAAQRIAATYQKGDVLSEGEREILYAAFSQESAKLPGLIDQIDYALTNNDEHTLSLLTNKLMRFFLMSSTIAGDKNAVSVVMNSMKRLNREISDAAQISRILDNGAC